MTRFFHLQFTALRICMAISEGKVLSTESEVQACRLHCCDGPSLLPCVVALLSDRLVLKTMSPVGAAERVL